MTSFDSKKGRGHVGHLRVCLNVIFDENTAFLEQSPFFELQDATESTIHASAVSCVTIEHELDVHAWTLWIAVVLCPGFASQHARQSLGSHRSPEHDILILSALDSL